MSMVLALLLAAVQFEEMPAAKTGITWVHQNGASAAKHLPETVGSGVAAFDYDGDGRVDLYFVNSAGRNALYRNLGEWRFEDVTERSGVAGGGSFGMGAAAADYDGDGDVDLFVTNFGGVTLYRNRGDGTFEDVTAKAGVAMKGWFTHAVFFDYDGDAKVDLFVSSFVEYNAEENRFCGDPAAKRQHYCIPRVFKPTASRLFRNRGDGTFVDVSAASGIAAVKGKAFGAVATDVNNDGRLDLFVANDTVANFLFINQGGKFVESGLLAGVAYSEGGEPRSGMGVDAVDFNGDGWQDLFVANIDQERFSLYRNQKGGEFLDEAVEIHAATRLLSGWGLRFFDYDNDGDPDLFLANGHPDDMVETVKPLVTYAEPLLMFRNDAGKFVDVSKESGAVFARRFPARGMATADLDNDGDLDVVVSNSGAAPLVLRNQGGHAGGFVGLDLTATKSAAGAAGVTLRWRAGGRESSRFRAAGGSYLSSHDAREVLGLGGAGCEWIEVRWPSGIVDRIEKPSAGRYLKVVEGKGAPLAQGPSVERLIDAGRLAEARAKLGTIEGEPNRVRLLEAMILHREGKAAESLAAVRALLQAASPTSNMHKLAALNLVSLGKREEAGLHLREAVRLDPQDAMARYYLGVHLLETQQPNDAAEALGAAVRLQPAHAEAHTMLGYARELNGDDERALAEYRQGVALGGKEQAHLYLARFLASRERCGEALPVLEAATRINPRTAETWRLLGKCLQGSGLHAEAVEALKAALALAPNDKRARYLLMQAYQKMGRHEDARRERELYEAR
ncbi:MAG: FG-GAP-like repeat-containing protein [Bryobacteraceae bacterium]|nr:FG-GAP-like repeat-containing protein [Bryobacteraceae bacterium]